MIASGPYATEVNASSDSADRPSKGIDLFLGRLARAKRSSDQHRPECSARDPYFLRVRAILESYVRAIRGCDQSRPSATRLAA